VTKFFLFNKLGKKKDFANLFTVIFPELFLTVHN